jgi:hypothetical protein
MKGGTNIPEKDKIVSFLENESQCGKDMTRLSVVNILKINNL